MRRKPINCQLLACDCEKTVTLDADRLAKDLGLAHTPEIFTNLCRSQLEAFEASIKRFPDQSCDIIVTCTQEAPLFQELVGEIDDVGGRELIFANIRETAGWSKAGKKAGPKIAALIAESAFDTTPTGLVAINSNGTCIIYGSGQQAMEVAIKLSARLSVSLVLSDPGDAIVPLSTEFPIHRGIIGKASGSLGKFEISLDRYAALDPSSKGVLEFYEEQNDVALSGALIFDLSGNLPLLGGNHGREGYFSLEPKNTAKIAEAMFDIIDLVGEFEKPIFTSYDRLICAHSRNGQNGCTRCIDNCPSSAIASNGDGIQVDNQICDGCGHCASNCPTGAIAYAFPNRQDLIGRAQTLISTYLDAGGKNPVLLIHENDHGGNLISALARFGGGLTENVLPFGLYSVAQIGHDALTAFFTAGVQTVIVLAPEKRRDELATLNFEIELTNGFLQAMDFDEGIGVQLLTEDDPDGLARTLAEIPPSTMPKPKNFIASGNKRETAAIALANLNAMAPTPLELLELPQNAPYGKITIDAQACTLCLACVSACPADALSDNENRPQVSLTEQACVQCGLCRITCPENAISLMAQYNFDKSALQPVILHEEEPLECSKCGKPFGSKSAIEKVIGILQGKNPMYQNSQQLSLLKMCDNCRVITMAENQSDPMTLGTVPKTLTAEDILPEDDEETRH